MAVERLALESWNLRISSKRRVHWDSIRIELGEVWVEKLKMKLDLDPDFRYFDTLFISFPCICSIGKLRFVASILDLQVPHAQFAQFLSRFNRPWSRLLSGLRTGRNLLGRFSDLWPRRRWNVDHLEYENHEHVFFVQQNNLEFVIWWTWGLEIQISTTFWTMVNPVDKRHRLQDFLAEIRKILRVFVKSLQSC